MFELMDAYSQSAVIKVIGVGGGGGNAVAHMVTSGIDGVEFMSSIGVSVIVRVARALASRDGKLVLLTPRPNVRDVLVRTSIDQIIPIHGDLESARTAVLAG